ncbi:MAG TPA: TraR/DksA C4-type zinc finger protein [Jatrophihabitans sp.]|nr:TraR/DksA C4-type zinc finger protein [Jatrophihabitans sp.]
MVTDSRPHLDYLLDAQPGPSLDHYARALREQRRFRVDQLRELDTASRPGAEQSEQLAEVRATLRSAAETALAEIDAALGRLDIGEYGRCVRCREQILPERLEILPAASLCMACQQAAEAVAD